MRSIEIRPDLILDTDAVPTSFPDDGFKVFLDAQSDEDLLLWASSTEGDLKRAFEAETLRRLAVEMAKSAIELSSPKE